MHFHGNDVFSKAQGYLTGLSELRKQYSYYIFLKKKHHLENVISTGTKFCIFLIYSEIQYPNPTDPDVTNTN